MGVAFDGYYYNIPVYIIIYVLYTHLYLLISTQRVKYKMNYN